MKVNVDLTENRIFVATSKKPSSIVKDETYFALHLFLKQEKLLFPWDLFMRINSDKELSGYTSEVESFTFITGNKVKRRNIKRDYLVSHEIVCDVCGRPIVFFPWSTKRSCQKGKCTCHTNFHFDIDKIYLWPWAGTSNTSHTVKFIANSHKQGQRYPWW